ncbi:MAG: DUF1552 domain-containing protein [Nannocystaceae bacterium]
MSQMPTRIMTPSRIKRNPWSRRAFLGGAGAVVGLPFLESMFPTRAARADLRQVPLRLVNFYVPNGIHMPAWTPQTEGADYDLPPILASLVNEQAGVSLREDVLVLTGLSNEPSRPDGPGDHAAGTAGFLTCRHIRKSETDIQCGISMDQVFANKIGDATPLASLQLGIEGGSNQGNCDSGYGCAYSRNISWANETTPLSKLTAPKLAFDLVFGGFDPSASDEELARRKAYRLSVLDYVKEEATQLMGRLGKSDAEKLDEYLTGVRDLESRLENGESLACDSGGFDASFTDFREQVDVTLDLMVLALQCDATRAITFMLGNASSGRSYDFLDVVGAHHDISHHGDDPENFSRLQTIDTWEVAQFVRLIQRMKEIEEGESNMLENSLVMFGSEIEDGNSHAHTNLPILVAGRAGGAIQSGRHMVFDGEPVADLFTSMLGALGVSVPSFGDDGTGPLQGLT